MQNYPLFHEVNPKYDNTNLNEIPKSILYTDTTNGYIFTGARAPTVFWLRKALK